VVVVVVVVPVVGAAAGGGWWGQGGQAGLIFLFSENPFAESQVGLSAHVRREGPRMLSAKSSSPVKRRREAVAVSFLSVKASPRGKTRSARVTALSAKGLNPVVYTARAVVVTTAEV
jgi:hypothetical protein